MGALKGKGQFIAWDGGCMLIGRAYDITPAHAHYALQVAFGGTHGIRFRSRDADPWTDYAGVVIASRHPHAMDATCVPHSAVILVDPETRAGRALVERYVQRGITALADEVVQPVATHLFSVWQASRDVADITVAARAAVDELAGGFEPAVISDERVLRATAYIRSHLDQQLTLEAVASEACLSPSRFRHLFVEQTGTAFRPYVLWRRFIRAWELVMSGASISAAAHAAGFADAAHLTRTSRTMFGFPPSALQVSPQLATAERMGDTVR